MPCTPMPAPCGEPPVRTPVLPAHPTSFEPHRIIVRTGAGDHLNEMPRLSRNTWGRPDLARLVSTEIDFAPYVSVVPTRRATGC